MDNAYRGIWLRCSTIPYYVVSEQENYELIQAISGREVRKVVWSLAEDKAPRSDSFPPLFFRQYWPIIQYDVVATVQNFFIHGQMPHSWKWTFVALISKQHDAFKLGNYKPISLCTILCKIYTKLMVAKMKPVLPFLIYPERGAFINDCSISDTVLIAHKFMHSLCYASIHYSLIIIKLDIEWAYDHIY